MCFACVSLKVYSDDVQYSLHDKDISSVHDDQHQTLPPDKEKNEG